MVCITKHFMRQSRACAVNPKHTTNHAIVVGLSILFNVWRCNVVCLHLLHKSYSGYNIHIFLHIHSLCSNAMDSTPDTNPPVQSCNAECCLTTSISLGSTPVHTTSTTSIPLGSVQRMYTRTVTLRNVDNALGGSYLPTELYMQRRLNGVRPQISGQARCLQELEQLHMVSNRDYSRHLSIPQLHNSVAQPEARVQASGAFRACRARCGVEQ